MAQPFAAAPAPLARILARGRPASDPGCAGCPQLGVFRALRRAGLEIQGASGCDAAPTAPFIPASGRWAAVTGAGAVFAGGGAVLGEATAAGARLVAVVDRDRGNRHRIEALLARDGARVVPIDRADPAAAEAAVRAAADRGGAAAIALSRCPRGTRAGPPLAIAAARCNRCGACLSLACPAIGDPGGEAIEIDPSVCTGCGLCPGLCRARAIAVAP